MKRLLLNLFLLLTGILFIWTGCSDKSANSDNSDHSNDTTYIVRPTVIFSIADGKPLYHYIKSQGVVKANKNIKLKAKISGFVRKSNIIDGRYVRKGDTLLAFRQKKWRYALQNAQNQFLNAQSTYKLKMKMRYAGGDPPDSADAVDPKVAHLRRINAGLAKAKIALQNAKLNLSRTIVTAPFSGSLAANRRFTTGTYVPAGTTLGQLVDVSTVRVRFSVLTNELHTIQKGMNVRITAPGGQHLNGSIVSVSPVVNTQSKVGTVTAKVNNANYLLYPGMIVSGRILVHKVTGKARIPRSAILTRHGRQLIFKLNPANNEVQWVYVHPASENSNWAIINNPKIEPGDTIAIDNNFSLSHLEKVIPKIRLLQRETSTGIEKNTKGR